MNRDALVRPSRAASRGMSLVEFAVATAIFSIIMLVGLATWQIAWTGMRDERNATLAHENAFGALHAIEEQVQRANTIQIPDPDNPNVPSMQVLLSPLGTNLRRAFRLVGNNLIMEWKDESTGARTIYPGVSTLTFTMLDAPTNTMVQIACSCTQKNRTVKMQTVAWRRN